MTKSIRFRLLAIFIFVFAAMGINSLWSVVNFHGLKGSIDDIMRANYRSVVDAQNMIVALERQDSAEISFIYENSSTPVTTLKDNEKTFLKWLSEAENNITEPGEAKTVKTIDSLYSQYLETFVALERIKLSKGVKDAGDYYYTSIFPLFEKTKNECGALLDLNQNAMVSLKNKAGRTAENATYSTLGISVLTILAGIITAFYFTAKITNPIYGLIEKIRKISDGDYGQKIDVSGMDEIAALASEFNTMARKLRDYELINVKRLMEEKQKAESIVESVSDGILVTDVEKKVTLVNGSAERALGISEKDAIGRHFLESVKDEKIFGLIENAMKEGNGSELPQRYADIATSDERTRHYRVSSRPITDADGGTIGVVTLFQDITKLKEVDDLKSEFVSSVSHEFRTPLTSISMAVGLLLDGVPGGINPSQKELLDAVREDEERLRKLVEELLDLSKIESGKIVMDIKPCAVPDILEYAVKPFGIQAKDKNVKIEVASEGDLPKVKADFNKISWVMTNLISNALRYSPDDGSGRISVNAERRGNKVVFTVSDNGKGIPEEFQAKLFEKFVRVEGGESAGGTGLGLAISKEMIKAHGGEIWLESRPGKGSTFYFSLNAVKEV